MSFEQVGPGILADTDKVTISIPHPDPCCVITSSEARMVLGTDNGSLLIFSNGDSGFYQNIPLQKNI